MGFLSKLFGAAKPRAVEWTGETLEVRLDPDNIGRWPAMMDNKTIRNRWAGLAVVKNRNGSPKLVVTIDRIVVGEVPANRLGKLDELSAALRQGVNVGIVCLTDRGGFQHAYLYLGKDYKYRPKPPWASE